MAKKKIKDVKVSFVDEYASEDVTGSGVLIETPNHKVLLDYGLKQSNDKYKDFLANRRKPKEFKAKDVDLIFLSHQHSDHSLNCPSLYRDGCTGATIVSTGSKRILKTMAEDSCYISERDVLVINSQYNKNYQPLYSIDDVNNMLEHTLEFPMNQLHVIDDEISFELISSGHLLGGCQIVLHITIDNVKRSLVYMGDIGNREIYNYFVGEYQPINQFVDLAICECTYGDRPDLKTGIKERNNDLNKLKSIIDTQIKELKGRVVIPTFAQSRCQQLALMIYELYKDEEWQPKVYIDSPLSIAIFKEYADILEGKDKEKFDELMKWDKLVFVKESEDSKALVSSKEPCLVLSSAGMCNVGRIRHHLKAVIPNPNATVLFVGFSTEGSLASILRDKKTKSVTIDDKEYKCRCASYSLKSMSGHMPFNQMLDTYSALNCNKIVLHHGSSQAKETFAKKLKERLAKMCKTTRVVIANSSLKFTL